MEEQNGLWLQWVFSGFSFLLVLGYWCFVGLKWLGNAALSNAIFTAAQASETMNNVNWTASKHTRTYFARVISSLCKLCSEGMQCKPQAWRSLQKYVWPSLKVQLRKNKGVNFCRANCGSWGEVGDVETAGEQWAREREWAPAGWFGALQLQFSSQGWLFSPLILWLQFSHAFFLVEKGLLLWALPVSPRNAPVRFLGKSGRYLLNHVQTVENFEVLIWNKIALKKEDTILGKQKQREGYHPWRPHGRRTNFRNPPCATWWAGFLFPLRSKGSSGPGGGLLETSSCQSQGLQALGAYKGACLQLLRLFSSSAFPGQGCFQPDCHK